MSHSSYSTRWRRAAAGWRVCCSALVVLSVALAVKAKPSDRGGAVQEALAPPYKNVYVLAVGVEDYAHCHNWPDLSYAIDDARVVARTLEQRFGYAATVLENPTKTEILTEIDAFKKKLTRHDVLIFFAAGHGNSVPGSGENNQQRVGYFIPRVSEDLTALTFADVREAILGAKPFESPARIEPEGDKPGQTDDEYAAAVALAESVWKNERVAAEHAARLNEASIRMDKLSQRLQAVRAKHVVVIFDACFAGLATRGGGGTQEGRFDESMALARHYSLLNNRSRSVFTAGTAKEKALEHDSNTRGYAQLRHNARMPTQDGITHGVFSYELISSLQEVPEEGMTLTAMREEVATRVDAVMVNMDGEHRMTPQLRPYGEGNGEFVFVPKPRETWLARAEDAITLIRKSAQGSGAGRGGMEQVFEMISRQDRERAQFARLMSKALVVLSYQAGEESPSEDLSEDPIWKRRHEIALSKASTGDPDAMAALFYMFRHGLGTAPDASRAGHWAAEASSSDSSDAHQAWATALREGIGVEGTAAVEQDRQAAQAKAQQQADQQKTAAVMATGAIVAMNSDNEKAGGLMLAGAALLMATSLSERPEESIEVSIAEIGRDVRELRGIVDQLHTRGEVDMKSFDRAKASIQARQRKIVQQARISRQGAVGQDTVQKLIGRTSVELVRAINEMVKPLSRKRHDAARQEFADVEIAYGKLVALMPYQLYKVSWE